jgi:hypothetical protein
MSVSSDTGSEDLDDLYSLLVKCGYAQHEAIYIAYGRRLARVGCCGSGFTIVDQNGGVGDCPGCPDCEQLAALKAQNARLLAIAKRYASECLNCVGHGFIYEGDAVTGRGPDDVFPSEVSCDECADIRTAIDAQLTLSATEGKGDV